MPARRSKVQVPKTTSRPLEGDDSGAVDAWLDAITHPLKPLIKALRQTVLAADPSITEGIKWNTASFYCRGWFATVNTRAKVGIQVVLHHGAKVRAVGTPSALMPDPAGLLTWMAADRATVTFADSADFAARQDAFGAIIAQWANYQKELAKQG